MKGATFQLIGSSVALILMAGAVGLHWWKLDSGSNASPGPGWNLVSVSQESEPDSMPVSTGGSVPASESRTRSAGLGSRGEVESATVQALQEVVLALQAIKTENEDLREQLMETNREMNVANHYAPGAIESAAGVTLVGFAILTGIAFWTRKDFSFLRTLLVWAGAIALLAIVAGVIFGFQLGTWFSVGMVGLAGAAILYDTSNVIHHYPQDRYVAAALQLFASVALMFWYVLRIFTGSRD